MLYFTFLLWLFFVSFFCFFFFQAEDGIRDYKVTGVQTCALPISGIDTEFEVLHNSLISLIPYIDFNRIAGAGNGLHFGVVTDVRLPVPFLQLNVSTKLEYRRMQPGYMPEYFDQTYDIGRVQYAVQQGGSTSYVSKYDAAQAAASAGT